jgi:phytoene dehydrogenase-like protein
MSIAVPAHPPGRTRWPNAEASASIASLRASPSANADALAERGPDARSFGWSRHPVVELVISSTMDDSLAPKGQHVASLFCQHVTPAFTDGMTWDDHRETVADLMVATVDRYAPGFASSVIGRQIMSPLDLERTFGLVGGDIFHGALTLDQLFSARPALGYADHRMPVPGLYLCGSGAHPGGGVTGAPGHNAAQAIIKDMRAKARR